MKFTLILAIATIAMQPCHGQSNGNTTSQEETTCCANMVVKPSRDMVQNYTLFNETLEFTIHFQNEGDATISKVIIRDTIDEALDIYSFRPIMGSHQFTTLINIPKHYIEFTFENINLPPHEVNEQLSRGSITFTIDPLNGLNEETQVNSKACVYFDNEPVFCTNSTVNTLVSQLPPITTSNNDRSLAGVVVQATPNPFFEELSLDMTLNKAESLELSIFNLNGQQVYAKSVNLGPGSHSLFIPAETFGAKGTYIYRVKDDSGFLTGKVVKLSD